MHAILALETYILCLTIVVCVCSYDYVCTYAPSMCTCVNGVCMVRVWCVYGVCTCANGVCVWCVYMCEQCVCMVCVHV